MPEEVNSKPDESPRDQLHDQEPDAIGAVVRTVGAA